MKKVFFTGVFALALVAIVGYGINKNQNVEQLSDLALQNVEALAQEEGGGNYKRNFTSAVVWYESDASINVGVSTTEPGLWASWTGNWKSIVCCVVGVDMDACNFTMEDPECKRRVKRGPRY